MSIISQENERTLEASIRKAGDILLSYWSAGSSNHNSRLKIDTKADGSIVTNADFESNRILVETIQGIYPSHGIMSEELEFKRPQSNDFPTWIIDPLDGTRPFVNGQDHFRILVGLAMSGRMIFGIVFFPVQQNLIISSENFGTRQNGRVLNVSTNKALCSKSLHIDGNCFEFTDSRISEGKADGGLSSVLLAGGEIDGLIVQIKKHKAWDIAPYISLVKEAGGLVTDEKGREPLLDEEIPSFKFLVGSNKSCHEEVLSLLEAKLVRSK